MRRSLRIIRRRRVKVWKAEQRARVVAHQERLQGRRKTSKNRNTLHRVMGN